MWSDEKGFIVNKVFRRVSIVFAVICGIGVIVTLIGLFLLEEYGLPVFIIGLSCTISFFLLSAIFMWLSAIGRNVAVIRRILEEGNSVNKSQK